VKKTILIVLMMSIGMLAYGQATIRIGSQAGVDKRIRVAAPPFASADPSLSPVAREMAEVIGFDLEFSGLFYVIAPAEYPPNFTALDPDVAKLDMEVWRMARVDQLVYGMVRTEGNEIVGQFRLFDLFSKQQIVGLELRVAKESPRLAAHKFSEEVIRYADGIPGTGTSEVCFSGGVIGKKEIYIADYDGANAKQLTKHGSISIKPRISPDGNKIAYLSYKDRFPFLYVYDRRTGKSTPISEEPGINATPSWSPDGTKLAMVLSKDGNMEIYLRDADGRRPVRLTKNRYMDTSPYFSPDGSQLAFVSDQGGSPQIYVMPITGGGGTRLSMQGGNSYDPSWSPDGKKIAYVVEKRGAGFQIWMMDANGSNPIQLTNAGGINESPSWSPDSRHVIYATNRNGGSELWGINIKTGQEFKLSKGNLRTEGPSWGPRRQ